MKIELTEQPAAVAIAEAAANMIELWTGELLAALADGEVN